MQAMKIFFGMLLALSLPTQIAVAGDPIFESNAQFEASQKARGEGLAAFRAGDAPAALVKLEEALALRPNNTLLLGYVAFLTVETGDLARAAEAATQYAATGQALGRGIQGKLAEKLPADIWAPIKAAFDANITAKGEATLHYVIPTDIALVEGIAAAPGGRLFVSSVVSGGLYVLEDDGPRQIMSAADHNMGSFFGITHDPLHGSLWATYGRVDQTPVHNPGHNKSEGTTGIAEFDAMTGALRHNYVLDGSTADHQIADLLITHDHTVYASDAAGKAVYKVAGNTLAKAFNLPYATSPQGLVETKDGILILADYGRGLWRLDRSKGTASLLGVPQGINLVGIDGLTVHGDHLLAVQNGVNPHRIMEITLSDDYKSVKNATVIAQSLPNFDEPTLGVSTPSGYVFVAGSQWPKYTPGGAVKESATIKPTHILKLTIE